MINKTSLKRSVEKKNFTHQMQKKRETMLMIQKLKALN